MKSPKIAIYVCGQWRGSSYKCSEYLNKIFNEYDCDFFIHTSNFYTGKIINFDELSNTIIGKNGHIRDFDCYYHTEDDISKIKQSYPNVVYFDIVTKEKNDDIDNKFTDITKMSSFNQFHNSYKCNEYRKIYENLNGFTYDVIIKIRPDIIFSEESTDSIKKYIELISNDKNIIFSKYHNTLEYILTEGPCNLLWDHWTFSSPFGMDCMMEWVKDILDGKETYSSDYILKYNLNPNPSDPLSILPPGSRIVRELFKFFDLSYLYKQEFENINYKKYQKNLVNSINHIFYMDFDNQDEKKLFYETYSICDKLINIFNTYDMVLESDSLQSVYFTEIQLQEFANYLKSKQHEYEEKLNNL
jgi:hypothetical protein